MKKLLFILILFITSCTYTKVDETTEIPLKIYNNGSLENVSNLPVGIYQMIYINGSFILISDTSSGGGSISEILYDQDVAFQPQNQMGTAETGIYIPDKYNFVIA